MSEGERTYTKEEFALILKKAAELAQEPGLPRRPAPELSLDDLKAIATEAGLDPVLIERAARLIPSKSRGSLLTRVAGRLSRKRLTASFPTQLTHERATHLLSRIRAATEHQGEGQATSAGLTWRAGWVSVTVHNEGGGSRVQISDHPWFARTLAASLGVLSGWILVGMLEPITAGVALGGVAGGLGVAVGIWGSMTHRARRRVDTLMDTMGRAMGEMAELPAASEEGNAAVPVAMPPTG